MKRWIAFLLAALMVFSLCACNTQVNEGGSTGGDESSSLTGDNSSTDDVVGDDVSEGGSTDVSDNTSQDDASQSTSQGSSQSGTSQNTSQGGSSQGTSQKPSGNSSQGASQSGSSQGGSQIGNNAGSENPHPTVMGSFMQPGAFVNHSRSRLVSHMQYLKEVGIDTLIVQWSFTTTSSNKVANMYYKDSFASSKRDSSYNASGSNLIENILAAAEQVGIKVFVGLNDNADWWSKAFNDKTWMKGQADLGLEGAQQLYDTYKKKYPNAFYGWYFVFEYYNAKLNNTQISNGAYFLSRYCDGLSKIDKNMPLMLSPFVSSNNSSAAQAETMWTKMIEQTSFREGDIFCCQDAVGAGWIDISQLDDYFSAVKSAVSKKKGLHFWANNEDFTQYADGTFTTAPLDRFVQQMKISSKYVEKHVTFAYSHYQTPDMGKDGYHEAYKAYYKTGKIPSSTLTAPTITVNSSAGGMFVEVTVTINNPDKTVQGLVITKNGKVLEARMYDNADQYGKKSYTFTFVDTNMDAAVTNVTYAAYATDYYGHNGPTASQKIEITSKGGKNVAKNKTYTTVGAQDSYPDEGGKTLTDGAVGNPTYADASWVGFLGQTSQIVIDLGSKQTGLVAFRLYTLGGGSAGIYSPKKVTVYVSDDGVNFTQCAEQSFEVEANTGNNYHITKLVAAETPAAGRYVKFEIQTGASWTFIADAEVFAAS